MTISKEEVRQLLNRSRTTLAHVLAEEDLDSPRYMLVANANNVLLDYLDGLVRDGYEGANLVSICYQVLKYFEEVHDV